MPSPFPGMDPYLEDPGLWPGFHTNLIVQMQGELNRRLSRRYAARVEERLYIADGAEDRTKVRVADVRIERKRRKADPARQPLAVAVIAEPMPILMFEEDVREPRIEILDTLKRDVVAVIELLSPANKRPGTNGRDSFRTKRDQVLRSKCHWVEIDLLRTGRPFTPAPRGVKCEYGAVVSSAKTRPRGMFWPIRLRKPLPTIGIPLRRRDPDVPLDLQAALDAAYDLAVYDRTIDYDEPPAVPLKPSDAAWADALLRAKGLRS